jgi:hypothetical protein
MYYKSIFDIDYNLLKKKNIKVLIFDLDNTIVLVDKAEPSDKVKELINQLKDDFTIFIASNNYKERVRKVGDALGVHAFYLIRKPSKLIKKLLEKKCDVPMDKVAIIGDQIMTDIFMGNRLGAKTILVDPLGEKDLKITFFNRCAEKIVMKRIKLKRGDYYEEIL